jgi:hypothetical protein
MAQPIILNPQQIRIMREIGKGYGLALGFSNVRISPTGGALIDWRLSSDTWNKLNDAFNVGCVDIEISREELATYLDWFDNQEKDELEYRSQFGIYRKRTDAEKNLFMFLKLAQAFNYPQDIKREDNNTRHRNFRAYTTSHRSTSSQPKFSMGKHSIDVQNPGGCV